MKKLAAGFGVAGLIALGMSGTSLAQDPMTAMQCTVACNTAYSQCLTGGTDMMIATTPAEGMNKLQMNAQNAMSCGEQVRACWATCM